MKTCKDCGKEKELAGFYKNGKFHVCRCKKCHLLKFQPPSGTTGGQFEKGSIPWNKGHRNTGFKPANGFKKGHSINKGVKKSKETIEKISKARFKMSTSRHCKKHRAWKNNVWERDKYECKFCGSSENLCAHHIRNWDDFVELRFDIENGITMCGSCHTKLHHIGKTFSDEHRRKLSESHKKKNEQV